MIIEVLYPEIANLFGDLANIDYIRKSIGGCEVIETGLKDKPLFLSHESKVDLVYMGTMTENSQVISIQHLRPYVDDIKKAIEDGTRFLMTGNAPEIFCKEIVDLDDSPYESKEVITPCLGIFDLVIKREMMHRFNSLYLGTYEDLEVVGFKSVFSYPPDDQDLPYLFETIKGPSPHGNPEGEGIHYKNFMGTWLTGPIMQLNPLFTIRLLQEMGQDNVDPPAMDAAMEAYEQRVREFKRQDLNYVL